MATSNDTTSGNNVGSNLYGPANKAAGEQIQASTFTSMLDVLSSLTTHTHTFYDDYTTVCDCQCQCSSSRGLL